MKKRQKISRSYQIIKNHKIVQRYDSSSIRRFRNHIRTIEWQNPDFRVYLRINYGNGFHNDGFYETQQDLFFALDTFSNSYYLDYLNE